MIHNHVAELPGLVFLLSGVRYGIALIRCAQEWPGKAMTVACIPGIPRTMIMSSKVLWEAIPLTLESMAEVSQWFPIREYLSDIRMTVNVMILTQWT